jgi:hypothetical protein
MKKIFLWLLIPSLLAGCKKEEFQEISLDPHPLESESPFELFTVDSVQIFKGTNGPGTKNVKVFFSSFPRLLNKRHQVDKILVYRDSTGIFTLDTTRVWFMENSLETNATYSYQMAYRMKSGQLTKLSTAYKLKL